MSRSKKATIDEPKKNGVNKLNGHATHLNGNVKMNLIEDFKKNEKNSKFRDQVS